MFTGIIESKGSIQGVTAKEQDCRLTIATGDLDLSDVSIGDSIAVNGCCLTVVELATAGFSADVSTESLRCTTLGSLQQGAAVNLEKAMRAGDRFGGHIVSGHVDGVGILQDSVPAGSSVELQIEAPPELARYIAAKGSICVDGTSLTVNKVQARRFWINVIPHTQEETIIGAYARGQAVNLEVDVVARYLERLMEGGGDEVGAGSGVDQALLERHGFKAV